MLQLVVGEFPLKPVHNRLTVLASAVSDRFHCRRKFTALPCSFTAAQPTVRGEGLWQPIESPTPIPHGCHNSMPVCVSLWVCVCGVIEQMVMFAGVQAGTFGQLPLLEQHHYIIGKQLEVWFINCPDSSCFLYPFFIVKSWFLGISINCLSFCLKKKSSFFSGSICCHSFHSGNEPEPLQLRAVFFFSLFFLFDNQLGASLDFGFWRLSSCH